MTNPRTVSRRTLLQTAAVAVAAGPLLAACSPEPQASGAPSATSTSPSPSPDRPRALIVHFSRAGENYWNGGRRDLDIGNTEIVATMISELVDADTYRIQPADPYPHDYEQTVARNVREQQEDARPQIGGPLPDTTNYPTILLGSPVWNVQEPMIMRTLIDGLDLAGKTIHPFVTYAVSGIGKVSQNYRQLIPLATVTDGLAIRGEEADQSGPQIRDWLRTIGMQPQR